MKKIISCLLLMLCGCSYEPIIEHESVIESTANDTDSVIIATQDDTEKAMPEVDEEKLIDRLIQTDTEIVYVPNEEYFIISQMPKQLYRKPHMDYFSSEPQPFESAVMATFYVGEYNEQSELPIDVYEYIMRSKPILHPLNGDFEFVDSLQYDINGEIVSVQFEEPMPGYTMVMPGSEFRKHFENIFGREVPYDESKSWIEHHGNTIGYLKDSDMYLYYRYDDGASAGFHGWNLYLYNEKQIDDLIYTDAIRYYSSTCYIDNSGDQIIYGDKYYKSNWQQLRRSETDYVQHMNLEDLLMPNESEFENWSLKFRQNENGSYALLSATCKNCIEDKTERLSGTDLYTIYKRKDGFDSPSNTLFQFNLSGSIAKNINEQIAFLSSNKNFAGFIIDEDENQLTLKITSTDGLDQDQEIVINHEITLNKLNLTFSDFINIDC